MSVRIVYEDIAVGAAEDFEAGGVGYNADISDLTLLPYGTDNTKYAALEPNAWTLDGSCEIYDDSDISFLGAMPSDENCEFEVVPTIRIYFDNQYSASGIMLVFGATGWCDEVNIKWYQSGALIADEDFYPNSAEYFCEKNVQFFNQLTITLTKTHLPNRRVLLDKIVFGTTRTFERNVLRNVNITQQIDPTSRTLAANALDWSLSIKDATPLTFQNKQPVLAYDGETLLGVFYVTDSDQVGDMIYNITCTDAIGLLGDDPFPDARYSNKNAYTLAQEICGDYAVYMDADLQTAKVTGILKDCTRRQALQQLCFAIGAVADTSGSDGIKIFTLVTTNPETIPTYRTRIDGSVTKADLVTAIELTSHSYSTSGSGDSVDINGTTYYDTKTVSRMNNPDTTANDKPNVIQISDATLVSSANVSTILKNLSYYYMRRDTYNINFRIDGETLGDYVTATTPWGDTVTGHYSSAKLTLSGITVSKAEIVDMPSKLLQGTGGGLYTDYMLITSSGTYTMPAGVTAISLVLIGGGDGGQGGGSGTYAVHSNTSTGNGGAGGNGGKVYSTVLSINDGAQISFVIGAGGTGGAASSIYNGMTTHSQAGAMGTAGGATTATLDVTFSSENGTRMPTGYSDLLTGVLRGTTGANGLSGQESPSRGVDGAANTGNGGGGGDGGAGAEFHYDEDLFGTPVTPDDPTYDPNATAQIHSGWVLDKDPVRGNSGGNGGSGCAIIFYNS